jgi:peroxiredoxin Q/BCP
MERADCVMRRGAALSVALAACLIGSNAGAELSVGDPAPAFSLPGSDGSTHSLARYRGKQGVVLAFFPKAFTPG